MFAQFPNFTKLNLEDRKSYDDLIKKFPSFGDTSFTNLHIWWNLDGNLAVSKLNDNLVINYSLPFDPEHSGYGLVGTDRIEDSIEVIFRYLDQQKQPVKLVNVPEFVINEIKNPQDFVITEELDFNEYIISSQNLANLQGKPHRRKRYEVVRFEKAVAGLTVEIKQLDLSSEANRQMILTTLDEWEKSFPPKNDPHRSERQSLQITLSDSVHLGTKNLCLYVDGKLMGFVLYHLTVDQKHYLINHLRVDYSIPSITDYISHRLAVQAVKDGVPYLNWEMDLGIEGLKQHKQSLRPIRFNRKFIVEPKS